MVGPDISDSRDQSQLQLLTSILDPNRAIDSNFFRFIVQMEDESIVDGIIIEETSKDIVMRTNANPRVVLARASIVEMKATGMSYMPEGFEMQLTPEQMNDLIGYIKNWRYPTAGIEVLR